MKCSQPAGVGFSVVPDDQPPPTTFEEASGDFSAFLVKFIKQYPQYFKNGLYVAGESFGGSYVPMYTADIIRKQLAGAPDALDVEIPGIILVNAVVDGRYSFLGHYDMFCTDKADIVRFNESACADIAAAMPEAERLQRLCETTLDPYVCMMGVMYGQESIYK